MASIITALGVGASSGLGAVPNHAPYYTMFNFFLGYVVLSPRFLKNLYKMDHNVNPREDVARFGEKAVQDGKITRAQLNMLKRNEAAHANSMEHFSFFVGSALFAVVAKAPNVSVNRACAIYSLSRIIYGWAYLTADKLQLSFIRSSAWWASTFACLYLLWESGKALNPGL